VQTVFNVLGQRGLDDPRKPLYAMSPGLPPLQETIVREPNLKLCSLPFTEECAGPITREVLQIFYCIPGIDLRFVVIDVRTHRMLKGDMPSNNTTWHADSERSFATQAQHIATVHHLFLSGPPFTEFVTMRNITFNPHALKSLPKFYAPAGQIVRYNSTELHRAQVWNYEEPGWRYFFRASVFPEAPRRGSIFENKIYPGPTPCSRPR
jgi:hypothetical protein